MMYSVNGVRECVDTTDVYTRLEMCTHDWRCVHMTGDVYTRLEMCTHDWRCVHTTGDVYTRLTFV
jgi:uncharacterized Fe-S cluster protein YjdI